MRYATNAAGGGLSFTGMIVELRHTLKIAREPLGECVGFTGCAEEYFLLADALFLGVTTAALLFLGAALAFAFFTWNLLRDMWLDFVKSRNRNTDWTT